MVTKSGMLGATGLLLPVLEVAALVAAASAFGALNTVVALIGLSAAGVWLLRIRLAGAASLLLVTDPPSTVPRAVASSVLAIVGAALLVLPGFVTGVVGLALQLGPVRNLIAHRVTGRFTSAVGSVGGRFVRADVIDVDLVDRSDFGSAERRSPSPGELEGSNCS